MELPAPDFGEVERPRWWGRRLGRRPRIVREANLAAALATLPPGAVIAVTGPNWVVYQMGESMLIRFRASEAWLADEPSLMPNLSPDTAATVHEDGRVVVLEGLHRTRGMARDKTTVSEKNGGIVRLPGWLDFVYVADALRETPSSKALRVMLFGDSASGPLVPAK